MTHKGGTDIDNVVTVDTIKSHQQLNFICRIIGIPFVTEQGAMSTED
jgi:hypothetical protein